MSQNSRDSSHIGVWNPADDPNRQHRWTHFIIPTMPKPIRGKYRNHPNAYFGMFVYQSPNKELYFFSYNVAFALGYDEPREAIEKLVPSSDKKRISYASGIFLNKEGVYNLISKTNGLNENEFKSWFDDYINKCENRTTIDVFDNCPI
ncbi:hypothetical protein HNY73_001051 [Argiope bruennichi]|uniref:Bro-N domain-containing protein n=1 Tax=Argiope bruennichi TaxID=94029 RepID=A0A8T0G2I3_ARGBR|nr:hypothetical protein HNY73_001051 [Argiope bruennichi]